MQKGWKAAGRLSAIWHRVGGRDALADRANVGATTLSAINSGRRRMGYDVARRIAAVPELNVTIFDLGAPLREETADEAQTLLDHLESLAALVELNGRALEATTHTLRRLIEAQRPELRHELLRLLDESPR